jgi:DNA-directed RNA polymerase alpha subunit
MNPYELADKLENATNISEVARLVKEEVIPMLRAKELTDEEIEAIRNREDLEYDNRFSLNFRTIGILKAENVFTLEELLKRSEKDLMRFPNMGKITVEKIKEQLAKHGFTLAN